MYIWVPIHIFCRNLLIFDKDCKEVSYPTHKNSKLFQLLRKYYKQTKDYLFIQRDIKKMSEEDDDNNSNKHSKPVTVIVKRIAKKDRIKEFEEWLSGISKEVSRQEGSMGIDIIKPTLMPVVNLNLNM